jgi:hypothetical protein
MPEKDIQRKGAAWRWAIIHGKRGLARLSRSGGDFPVFCPKKRDFKKFCKLHAINA